MSEQSADKVILLGTQTWRIKQRIEQQKADSYFVVSLTWMDSGNVIVTGPSGPPEVPENKKVRFWDVGTGQLVRS